MKLTVTSIAKPDLFEDRVSVGDSVEYEFDFSPWLQDKGSIINTVWVTHSGVVGLSSTNQTGLLTFNQSGIALVSCQVTTDTGESKKVWLRVRASDLTVEDDYGMMDG